MFLPGVGEIDVNAETYSHKAVPAETRRGLGEEFRGCFLCAVYTAWT
jgi:hypothetical protein